MKLILALAIISIFASPLFAADRVKVVWGIAHSPYIAKDERIMEAMEIAKGALKKAGIALELKQVSLPDVGLPSSQKEAFKAENRLNNYLARRYPRADRTLVITGPFAYSGSYAAAGDTIGQCLNGYHTTMRSTVWMFDAQWPADPIGFVALVVGHELAHTVGAQHDMSTPNLMSYASWISRESNLRVLPKARREMRNCLRFIPGR